MQTRLASSCFLANKDTKFDHLDEGWNFRKSCASVLLRCRPAYCERDLSTKESLISNILDTHK